MKNKNCIYCGRETFAGEIFCNKRCEDNAMIEDPEFFCKKIDEIKTRNLHYKQMLKEKIEGMKKEGKETYKERGEYILRKITTKNKTGDAYGITLPKSVWKKYDRFICDVQSNGIIILIPKKLIEVNKRK